MSTSTTTSLNSGFVYAILIALFVLIAGFSGLFKTSWNIGAMIVKIPVWFWLVLGALWLANAMRG